MRERGLTLVEVLVSLTVGGVAAVAIVAVFTTGLRTLVRQVEMGDVRANLRTAMATMTREFRGLSVGGEGGSDIIEMENSSLTYRAIRSTSFVCSTPDPLASSVTIWRDPQSSLRPLEAGRDSLLLFADNSDPGADDDEWMAAALVGVSSGDFCPGAERGFRLTVAMQPGKDLGGVNRGAAVQGYQVTNLRLYSTADGLSWIGLRELRPGTGWSVTQPILGPVARHGLRFDYLRADGGVAERPEVVALISVTVVGVGYGASNSGSGSVTDSLTFQVALRNNLRRN